MDAIPKDTETDHSGCEVLQELSVLGKNCHVARQITKTLFWGTDCTSSSMSKSDAPFIKRETVTFWDPMVQPVGV